MIDKHRRRAILGFVLALLLFVGFVALFLDPRMQPLSGLCWLAAQALWVWACVQYARAKGQSPLWGLYGLLGILGLLRLAFLRDRDRHGQAVRKVDEVHLFPSDARLVTLEGEPVGADPARFEHEFRGRFGSAVAVDQFGFVRDGCVSVEGSSVILAGPRHWSLIARSGAFVGFALLCTPFLGVLLGPLVALVLLHYFAASQASLELSARTIRSVRRDRRKLSFYADDPGSHSSVRKRCIFRADCEANAIALERELESCTQAGTTGPALPSNFAA